MKRRILSLLMAGMLVLQNQAVVFASDAADAGTETIAIETEPEATEAATIEAEPEVTETVTTGEEPETAEAIIIEEEPENAGSDLEAAEAGMEAEEAVRTEHMLGGQRPNPIMQRQ